MSIVYLKSSKCEAFEQKYAYVTDRRDGQNRNIVAILKSKSPYLGNLLILGQKIKIIHVNYLKNEKNHLNNEIILNHFQNIFRNHFYNVQDFC